MKLKWFRFYKCIDCNNRFKKKEMIHVFGYDIILGYNLCKKCANIF